MIPRLLGPVQHGLLVPRFGRPVGLWDGSGWVPELDFDTGMTYTDFTPPLDITTIAALQTWLDANVKSAAGSWSTTVHKRVLLGAGRTYTGAAGLDLAGYSHATFEGGGTEVTYEVTVTPYGGGTPLDTVTGSQTGGAEFVVTGDANGTETSAIRSTSGASVPADDLRFHAFHTEGNQTNHATTSAGNAGAEKQMSFLLYGATNILIDHVSADHMRGDFAYLSDRLSGGGGEWCDNITIRYSHCANNGRQGVAIIAGSNVLVEHSRWTDIAMGVLDIEPNEPGTIQGAHNVEFSRNLIDGTYYSWDSLWNDPWFQTNNEDADGTVISGYLKAIDNGLTAGMHMTGVTSQAAIGIYKPTGTTKTAVLTITGNTSSAPKAASYGCTVGGFINGGTITDNKGFLSSGTWYNDIGGNGSITQSGNT